MESGKLTPKQQRCLEWIEGYIDAHGRSPVLREIQTGLGYRSVAPIQALLTKLKAKGFVDWETGKVRTISVSDRENPLKFSPIVLSLFRAEKARCEKTGLDFDKVLIRKLANF
jgi:repressor LexA